jgi:hypothetical protein
MFELNNIIVQNNIEIGEEGLSQIYVVDDWLILNKYKTFSVLIYNYINTSGNWENEKLCGFTQFRVFPISTSVDITVYQNGKMFYIFFII